MEDFDTPDDLSGRVENGKPYIKQPNRKAKKIQLEIYEDLEAAFYLALSRLKANGIADPSDIKVLLDSIHYHDEDRLEDRERKIVDNLRLSWEFIHRAGKHSPDYFKVSGESFDAFLKTEFCESLKHLYYQLLNLKEVCEKGDVPEIKTELSAISLLIQVLSSSLEKGIEIIPPASGKAILEQTSQGIFKINRTDGLREDLEIYSEVDGELRKIYSLEDLNDPSIKIAYILTDVNALKMSVKGNTLTYTLFSGVTAKDSYLDFSSSKEQSSFTIPADQLASIKPLDTPNQFEIETNFKNPIEVETIKRVEISPDSQPGGIDEMVQKLYQIPEGVKKESYLRFQVIHAIFEQVSISFPDLTQFVKSIVTGYLCIPFRILDSEDTHIQSERTQTYHEYVGKTVRNTLNSKPFPSEWS